MSKSTKVQVSVDVVEQVSDDLSKQLDLKEDSKHNAPSPIFSIEWGPDYHRKRSYYKFRYLNTKEGVTVYYVNKDVGIKFELIADHPNEIRLPNLGGGSPGAIAFDGGAPNNSFYVTGPTFKYFEGVKTFCLDDENLPVGDGIETNPNRRVHPNACHWNNCKTVA